MHNVKEYIRKIVDDGDRQEMEELSEMLDSVVKDIYKYDEKRGKEYEMYLYRMAYGDVLNKEMAEKIVSQMQPYGMRWSLEQSRDIQNQFGLDNIRELDFFVVLNSSYNDYRDLFGDNLEMYARYTKDFILDEDAKDNKVFKYFTIIAK